MSLPEKTFLVLSVGIVGISMYLIWARARTQLITRRWLRYLRESIPADATFRVYPPLPSLHKANPGDRPSRIHTA